MTVKYMPESALQCPLLPVEFIAYLSIVPNHYVHIVILANSSLSPDHLIFSEIMI